MITQQQAAALAEVLAMIRPNDWKPAQLMNLFGQHHEAHNFPALAEAGIRAARNPALRSPDAIFLPGKHWEATEHATPNLPDAPKCPEHPWEDQHHCRACLADVKAGDRDPRMIGRGPRTPRKPSPPPPGYRPTYGDPGTTSPTKRASDDPESTHATESNQQLPASEALGAAQKAPQESRRAIPHPAPTEPGGEA